MQINELLAKIDALKAEIDQLRPLKPEVEHRIMQKFRLDWNYHSNAIEGNTMTLGETKVLLNDGITAGGKPIRDAKDILGHDAVLKTLDLMIAENHPLSEALIRQMHKELLQEPYYKEAETPDGRTTRIRVRLGEYKQERNTVHTPTGQTHEYVLPEDVPAEMEKLLKWHREQEGNQEVHPLVHASLFHHRFLSIHPFDDGNGRMGRILMNFILMKRGFPPAIVKKEDRNPYVSALGKADVGETQGIVQFIGQSLIDAEMLYLRGARGESIEDSNDVDKQLALLKQQLRDGPTPVELTAAVQKAFFEDKLTPLIERIDNKVRQFDELFRTSFVELRHDHERSQGRVEREQRNKIIDVMLGILQLADYREDGIDKELGLGVGLFRYQDFQFRWEEFQRDGTNDFPVQVGFTITFEKNKYRLACEAAKLNVTLMYQEWLTEDEVDQLISALAKSVLDQIQQRLRITL